GAAAYPDMEDAGDREWKCYRDSLLLELIPATSRVEIPRTRFCACIGQAARLESGSDRAGRKCRKKACPEQPPRHSFPDECCRRCRKPLACRSARRACFRLRTGPGRSACLQRVKKRCERRDRDSGTRRRSRQGSPEGEVRNSCSSAPGGD